MTFLAKCTHSIASANERQVEHTCCEGVESSRNYDWSCEYCHSPERWNLVYRFLDFDLNTDELRLYRNGSQVALDPKNLQVLCYLLENRGRLVRKQELLDHVWPETAVTENALTRVIARLRKTLEDHSRTPRYIETVPTLGFRFIAEVSTQGTVLAEARPALDVSGPPPVQAVGADVASYISRRSFLRAATAVVAVGSISWLAVRKRRLPPAMSVAVPLLDRAIAADIGQLLGAPVIAPDGSAIVASLNTPDGAYLFRRPLDANRMTRIEGTQYASLPFWSPDSQHIGFFADRQLKRMPAFGGSSVVLCEVVAPRGGCWSGDNILFAPNLRGIFRVPATGGTAVPVTTLDVDAGENSHRFPLFLPDGSHFLYFARSSSLDKRGIYVQSFDLRLPRRRVLVADGEFALGVVPNSGKRFLITQQAGKLIAQEFDCDHANAFGPEHILLDHAGQVSVSETGALALRTEAQVRSTLVWRDRNGRHLGTLGKPDDYWQVAISPDSRFVAIVRHSALTGAFRAWIASLPNGEMEVLSEADHVDSVAWSHDGGTLYYIDYVQRKLFRRRVDPRGPEEFLQSIAPGDNIRAVAPDGLTIVVERSNDTVHATVELFEINTMQRNVVDSENIVGNTSLSPDGRTLAFGSKRSGRMEVYLADFPSMQNVRRVSINGGSGPRWRHDGMELFYIADDETLVSLPFSAGGRNRRGNPKSVLRLALVDPTKNTLYDVTKDGSRLLLVEPDSSVSESDVELIINWPSLIVD